MLEQGGGSIVNISSIGGMIPDVTRIGYGVSKAAINNITQQIAMQYARNNIRCNAVLPGLTGTDAAMKNMPDSFIRSFLSHVPLNRIGTPEDVANAVLFLSSDDASYITGHILDVAGGYGHWDSTICRPCKARGFGRLSGGSRSKGPVRKRWRSKCVRFDRNTIYNVYRK